MDSAPRCFGFLSNADSLCLADLTANDWLGKADAVSRGLLQSGNVKAFLCKDSSTCNNALANVTYFFAVAGDTTKGGASFTTDGSGRGPQNNADWSGTNHFDGSKEYWTGRTGGGIPDLWPTLPTGGSWAGTLCNTGGWASNSSGHSGAYGSSNDTDAGRWHQGNATCNTTRRLVCFVHP